MVVVVIEVSMLVLLVLIDMTTAPINEIANPFDIFSIHKVETNK